jgi:hypothetical protein
VLIETCGDIKIIDVRFADVVDNVPTTLAVIE